MTTEIKPRKPTKEELTETMFPDLSQDKFTIGTEEFQVKLLPILVEKKFIRAVTELIEKLNLSSDESMLNLFTKDVSTKLDSITDLLIDLVTIICQHQKATITAEYVANNCHSRQLFNIIVSQLKKQELLDIIAGFIQGVLGIGKNAPVSPTS